MQKREFLAALGTTTLASAVPAAQERPQRASPTLLTVTGAIGRGNRGPLDKALDQMMVKQQLAFDRAHVFDFEALRALPAVTIRPTLEYDAKVHTLRGPLLSQVVEATGARMDNTHKLVLRAIDGYTVSLGLAQARRYRFIIATHLDGHPMPLGGLGPLWAVFDTDRHADIAARPLAERYAQCPWGLYHLEVQATQAVG
ncbi:MAG: molybdopterin-dependent oxidoreductase [Hydrogenophaga sp.]|nr:molybdopterin-dependent oxidoreductase [Hydrogenophaga sp.]